MAYTKQTFTSGQTLKASDLNTMSQGIVDKQDKLVSGTSIKTINGTPLLGSGDFVVGGGIGITSQTLLVNILRNAVFVNDQSENIDALALALESDGGGSDSGTNVIVINNLSGVTTSNTATSVAFGSSYTATLTAIEGSIASISVQMGGTDITKTCYSNGVINIPTVTGNIIINASNASIGGYVQNGLVHEFTSLSAKKTISGGQSLLNSGADFTVIGAAKKTDTMSNYAHSWVGVETKSLELHIARNWNNQLKLRACVASDTSLTNANNKMWKCPDGVDVDGMLYVWVVKNGSTVTMTVNGIAVGSITQGSALVFDGDLVINNSGDPIPKLMIYNRALTEEECEQNYASMKAEVGE